MKVNDLPHYEEELKMGYEYTNNYRAIIIHRIKFDGCYLQQFVCLMPLDRCKNCLVDFYFRSVYDALKWFSQYHGYHTSDFWKRKWRKHHSKDFVVKAVYDKRVIKSEK